MLRLTERAAATLGYVRWQMGLPEHVGVRVFTRMAREGKATFQVGFVEEPEAGDEVADGDGTRVFVASGLAGPLADYVLDAEEDPNELGGAPRLVLRRRR